MRPVHLTDLDACARCLHRGPETGWPGEMDRIIRGADLADRFRKRTGRVHAKFGNGSLMSAIGGLNRRRGAVFCDASYCRAMQEVLVALDRWRERHHSGL